MNSVILQIASRYVKWLLLIFAFIALFRGHNYPGGGFIGGLLAALSFVFNSFAYNAEDVEKRMSVKPEGFIAIGLGAILLSFVPSVISGKMLMTGMWFSVALPVLGDIKLGTPFLFDIGIFFAVIGVTLLFLFTLTKNEIWN